jgi:hypothetical protein
MSTARYIAGPPTAPGEPGTVGGPPLEQTWTTIAAEQDGEVLAEEIGKRKTTLSATFAYREEAEAWISAQAREGWTFAHGPTPTACLYFGPTDSPGNAWSVEVEREAID